jgi:hypothetical protein
LVTAACLCRQGVGGDAGGAHHDTPKPSDGIRRLLKPDKSGWRTVGQS